MSIKTYSTLSNKGLDRQVNKFLEMHPDLDLINIQFFASFVGLNAMILYR